MRAAITSQQNLKRREAAFLLGATAFRTREMQKCASPFVEVRQIEFLARETPNCTLPRTCTHIPSMTCESVSGSHLRERSDAGRNTTHPLDPDKLTKMEPRVPSLHCNLKREQNPAFLVSGGSSYCPLCSTPRSRGRSAPMTSPRPWLICHQRKCALIPAPEVRTCFSRPDYGRELRQMGTSGGFPSPRKAAPTQWIMIPSSP